MVCWGEGPAVGVKAHLRSSVQGGGDRTQGQLFVLSLVLNFGTYENMFCLLLRKMGEEGEPGRQELEGSVEYSP